MFADITNDSSTSLVNINLPIVFHASPAQKLVSSQAKEDTTRFLSWERFQCEDVNEADAKPQ